MRHVEANGLRFALLEAGDPGHPLALLLHGFPDTPHSWQPLADALASAGYHVVAPFMRGYTPTGIPPRDATVDDLAADAIALIAATGHERAALLVGHDWGAATAYLATTIAPERIERLVAVGIPHPSAIKFSPTLLWAGRHFLSLRWPLATLRMRLFNFALVDKLYRRWSPEWAFGPEETAPVKAVFSDPQSLDAAIGYYRSTQLGRPSEAFRGQKIAAPTLAILGLSDPGPNQSMYESAQRKFTGPYQVEALPGGHFVHRESSEAFVNLVLDFAEVPARSAPSDTR